MPKGPYPMSDETRFYAFLNNIRRQCGATCCWPAGQPSPAANDRLILKTYCAFHIHAPDPSLGEHLAHTCTTPDCHNPLHLRCVNHPRPDEESRELSDLASRTYKTPAQLAADIEQADNEQYLREVALDKAYQYLAKTGSRLLLNRLRREAQKARAAENRAIRLARAEALRAIDDHDDAACGPRGYRSHKKKDLTIPSAPAPSPSPQPESYLSPEPEPEPAPAPEPEFEPLTPDEQKVLDQCLVEVPDRPAPEVEAEVAAHRSFLSGLLGKGKRPEKA